MMDEIEIGRWTDETAEARYENLVAQVDAIRRRIIADYEARINRLMDSEQLAIEYGLCRSAIDRETKPLVDEMIFIRERTSLSMMLPSDIAVRLKTDPDREAE